MASRISAWASSSLRPDFFGTLKCWSASWETWREVGNAGRGDACEELALTVYTGMASIASKHTAYREYLDVVQLRMAEMLMAGGQLESAGRLYRELLKRTPDTADALSNMGKIYEKQGNWDQALEVWRTYSKGIEAGSDAWLDARYRIAMAHRKMGREPEACEVITMIRVLHPDAGDEALRAKILDLGKVVCGK